MRRINEKVYEIWELDLALDAYGERARELPTGKYIRANIFQTDQVILEDNIKYVVTYYNGITNSRELKAGQMLVGENETYKIETVNLGARRTQLVLEKSKLRF